MRNQRRKLVDGVKRWVARPLFETLQRFGLNVTLAHYYSEIPDLRALRSTASWRRAYDLSAVGLRSLPDQLDILRGWSPSIASAHKRGVYERAIEAEGSQGYGPVEACVLYGFIVSEWPSRILQVGGGVSTSIMLQALQHADGPANRQVGVVCVEPFPSEFLRSAAAGGRIDLVEKRAQDWDPTSALQALEPGDFLFVDSTHTTTPGSDVNRIILEWLPTLPFGIWVHFHDIYLPYDYAPGLLTSELFFGRESLVLQAFLTCNARFRVEVSLSLLHHRRAADLGAVLGDLYTPRSMDHGLERSREGHFPSSVYFRSVGAGRH